MFQKALTLDYFRDMTYPESPEAKYEHMKAHIDHIEFIILQAKDQINDFKKMAHQLKMELIVLREKLFFETNEIPEDSHVLIDGFKKRVKNQNDFYENESNRASHELREILKEKHELEKKIEHAKEKLETLENVTGNYGFYYQELTKKRQ